MRESWSEIDRERMEVKEEKRESDKERHGKN